MRRLLNNPLIFGLSLILLVALLLATSTATVASSEADASFDKGPQETASQEDAFERLDRATGGTAIVSFDSATGVASFIRFPQGLTVVPAVEGDNSAVVQANAFFVEYGEVFGITNPVVELNLVDTTVDNYGNSHVTYRQVYQSVPVFAGELKVHLNEGNEITAVNGTFVPDIHINTTPTLSIEEAGQIAVDAVARQSELRMVSHDLSAVGSVLYVYRTGLLQGVEGRNHLVYEVEVTNTAVTIREFVYVDAHIGVIVDQITGILTDLDREVSETSLANVIWDESNGDPDPIPPGWAGGSAQQVTDWQNEIDGASETYYIFASMAGWDSYDNAGSTMRTVNNDPNISCPNANWNGTSTNYCSGVTGDDTVAHEWGHAYTEYTNNLIYAWQSGALNESYSDIWGDAVDLLNGRGTDTPGGPRSDGGCSIYGQGSPSVDDSYRWLSGEDDPAFGGAIRDLWNPVCYGDPGKVTDTEYWCSTGDSGGVHTNSGVPNHAFALLVDGGTYNSQTVTALGLTKASHIEWGAQNILVEGSNFIDSADALEAACTALIGIDLPALSTSDPSPGLSGEIITAADCQEVSDAIAAVELRTPPDQCNFGPLLDPDAPPLCEGVGDFQSIGSEDWEGGVMPAGWVTGTHSVANPPTFDTPDWAVVSGLPEGANGTYAAFVADLVIGDCGDDDESGALYLDSPVYTIPVTATVPRVAFDHWVATEVGWDGGNLKVSVNGGAWTLVPSNAYDFNEYNLTLNIAGNTNPLAGEGAFSGTDGGSITGSWGQSQAKLTALVAPGDDVQFRYDFGIDGCNGLIGWYVDDFEVYSCSDEVAGVCGDSILDPGETCDDGNTANGDGCSDVCQVEDGWICTDPIPPVPGANAVADGSFEAGTPNPDWAESSTNFGTPICSVGSCGTGTGTGPSDGLYWTWFGGIAAYEEGAVSQALTIPSTATDLTFDLEQIVCDSAADYMEMLVDGNQEFVTDGSSALCGQLGYAEQTIDLSAYADDAVHSLEFHSEIFANNAGGSNFFVDDVYLSDNLAVPGSPSECRILTTDIACNGDVVDFEGGIPTTWSTSDINNVYWTDTDDLAGCTKGNMTNGSGVAACADSDATNESGDLYDAEMTSNSFDLTGVVTATLVFEASYNDIGFADIFEVDVWDGSTWNNELSWDEDHWDPPETVTLDLSAYTGLSDVMVRYRYAGDDWDWWAQVDDVSLTCAIPEIDVDPASLASSQPQNAVVTMPITVTNTGAADLDWTIDEADGAMHPIANSPLPRANQISTGDLTFSAAPGDGDTVAYPTANAPEGLVTLTHSASQAIVDGNSVACAGGGLHADNSYLRIFDLESFGLLSDFDVASVQIGIQAAAGADGTQPASMNLYTWDPADPFTFANFNPIGGSSVTVDDQDLTILTVPVVGTAPAGSTLVVEFFTPDGQSAGNALWVGSNPDGQTAPTYLAAASCGIPEPVDTAAIGFPDMHLVMNVTGNAACTSLADIPWVSAVPLSGTTAPLGSDIVDVTFDSTGYSTGVYTGTLCVFSNDPSTPLVPVPLTMTVEQPTGVSLTSFDETTPVALTPIWLATTLMIILAGAALTWRRRLVR